MKDIKKLKEEIQELMAQLQNRRRRSITCWGCGEPGHLRRNYHRNNKKDRSTKCWGCGRAGHLRNNCPRVNQKHPHRANVIESKEVCRNRKGSAEGNGDVPSRRPCPEKSKYYSRVKNKFGHVWEPCAERKDPRKRTRGRLQLYNAGERFERIAFDILGPLPKSSDGNSNILVMMDYFTKWPEAYLISDQEASTVAEVLDQHWISRFGVPLQLHSDQARNFDSEVCKRLCEILAIDKTRTTALHPQSDGMIVRHGSIEPA
ncbi:retrovirus-related Pol polyprotein from transposon 412 [Trichonephila clavipes]|nr:retrovirus-related Pol polyprotein from transposon 412 [Trichonephila clavipes]